MTDSTVRSIEDVDNIVSFAKLNPNDLYPVTQCLKFEKVIDDSKLILIEVNPSVLKEVQEANRIFIRGEKNESAVLCTLDASFELISAETSNSLLVLSDLLTPETMLQKSRHLKDQMILAQKYSYYELKQIKPRLNKLRLLLEENVYSGQELEQDEYHQGKKYVYEELLELVQASKKELEIGLKELQACQIDGFWRMLEFDFVSKVLMSIISLQEENNWSFNSISLNTCLNELESLYSRNVIHHVLKFHSENLTTSRLTTTEESDNEDDVFYTYDENKICRFFAEVILRPYGEFHYEDFIKVWQQSVPEGMRTEISQLKDMVIIDHSSKPSVIKYFDSSKLPEDTNLRFDKLFKAKDKWTLEEITPFLMPIATDKVGVSSLLLKNARASTKNGEKVYSTRRPLVN